jgi:hypothetical protein
MRSIPVRDLVVIVTVESVRGRGALRWRGHWSAYPLGGLDPAPLGQALAEGDSDLYLSKDNAYLFAGAEGVAVAEELVASRGRGGPLSSLGRGA